MRYLSVIAILVAALIFRGQATMAQDSTSPDLGPEWDVLQSDVGTWDVEIKAWSGPGKPTLSKGTETNRLLGNYWLLSDFKGNMMGMDFSGHGTYSYDAEKKQYYGTWIDSFSPNSMKMVGKHDSQKRTMTYEGMAPGPDGAIAKHIIETQYNDDGTRIMTMQMQKGGTMIKIFEMKYTQAMDTSTSN